jgi:hypothetical protein
LRCKTVGPDVEDAQQHVAVADQKLAVGVAHRRRPVAAAAGLVEHQRTVPALQPPQQLGGGLGDQRARRDIRTHQKNPCALLL